MNETSHGQGANEPHSRRDPNWREQIKKIVTDVVNYLSPSEEQVARNYLSNFNLAWELLEARKTTILDIGAGDGAFAAAAKKRKLTVTAFDKYLTPMGIPALKQYQGIDFVQGDALDLADYFSPQRFGLILSRSAVKYIVSPKKDQIGYKKEIAIMEENFQRLFSGIRYVLKDDGEFRFDSDEWMADLYKCQYGIWPSAIPSDELAQFAYTYLRKTDPHISMDWGKDAEGKKVPFFVLRKERR